MHLQVGTNSAVDSKSDGMVLVNLEGRHTIDIYIVEGTLEEEVVPTVAALIEKSIQPGTLPLWVETPEESLTSAILDHYGLPSAFRSRPVDWEDE